MAAQDHVAVQQIQIVKQGLAEGFELAVPNQEETLQEVNVRIQSLTNRLNGIQTNILARFTDFRPFVVEIEEDPEDDDNTDEEQANAENNEGLDVLINKVIDGCDRVEAVVVHKINILLAAFKRRFS